MYPTWPMLFAALVAGALLGFMVPDRPAPRASAVEATAPAQTSKDGGDAVRKVPLTKSASAGENASGTESRSGGAAEAAAAPQAPCSTEHWPYRQFNCLDRTAEVAAASTVVKTRTADPLLALRDSPAQSGAEAEEDGRQNEPAAAERNAKPEPRRRATRNAGRTQTNLRDGIPTRVYLRGPDGRLYLAPEYHFRTPVDSYVR